MSTLNNVVSIRDCALLAVLAVFAVFAACSQEPQTPPVPPAGTQPTTKTPATGLVVSGTPAGKGQTRVGTFGPANPTALPFRFEAREVTPPGQPPRLHSFCHATVKSGHWLMLGGRGGPAATDPNATPIKDGLHGFTPATAPAPASDNFPKPSYNTSIWVYHPVTGELASCDVRKLGGELPAVLQLTSQQFWYDQANDQLWIAGGYGWKPDGKDMTTYDTLVRVSAEKLATAVLGGAPPSDVTKLFEVLHHGELAVTGGEMVMVGDVLYLVFGHFFDRQYFAFGEGKPRQFEQTYKPRILAITMVPGRFEILDVSPVGNADPEECSRRDLNVRMTKDATSGKTVVGIYGGVFKSGGPGGYEHPITFTPDPQNRIEVHTGAAQLFNAYSTAVASIWSAQQKVMAQVFFGGIGRGVYHTHDQEPGLDNDGMPFGSDISVLTHRGDGSWAEWVLEDPVPGNQLLATNGHFVINPQLRGQGQISDQEIVLLDNLAAGQRTLIGWVYGGILADLPQPPKGPSTGKGAVEVPSKSTNQIFEIYVTRGPGSAVPVLGK